MLKIAVLDDYQNVSKGLADWGSLGREAEVTVFTQSFESEAAAIAALADFDVLCLMRERMALSAQMIAQLPKLKLINVTGARVRVIDVEAAKARGIPVCHTYAGESRHATPELAWALILAAARDLGDEHGNMRKGAWQETIGTTLGGKTLGLVGLGKLGARMVPIARAFEMDVIAWSANLTEARAAEVGAKRVEKAELFARADVVSLHLVLSDRSRGIVGAPEIGQMKEGAILVNTSRGPLIDEAALLSALQSKRIRAGLDVYDVEPLPAAHPLRQAPNVVLTPHLGYVVKEAYGRFYQDIVENIAAWRAGTPIRVLY